MYNVNFKHLTGFSKFMSVVFENKQNILAAIRYFLLLFAIAAKNKIFIRLATVRNAKHNQQYHELHRS